MSDFDEEEDVSEETFDGDDVEDFSDSDDDF
jgi:hypothetical protein